MSKPIHAFRVALLGATVLAAAPALAAADFQSQITVRDNLNPGADGSGALDPNDITGIGQMTVDEGDGYVGLCTGTLINPRTVIFAAHCVNDADQNSYGTKFNGIPISFGFHSDNLPAIIDWLGYGDDPTQKYKTNVANALYNVEQVWYDKRSTALGPDLNFLQGDIAIATLDTPASKIPTWALLFSPLTTQTHAAIVGYGDYGNGTVGSVDLDFRRRAANNVVSLLGSLDDVDSRLFGQLDGLPQSLYQLDFDDPKHGTASGNANDFNIFGGTAVAKEGITAPGDSGGPLIVDLTFARQVVAGVLSGGSTFYDGQAGSSYGTTSFYQPLFLYWDEIVNNNPYRYTTNLAGNAEWTDPRHWVQTMDPNYEIIRGGQLYNGLPSELGQRTSSNTFKYGKICDGTTCSTLTGGAAPAEGTGPGLVVNRGPGATDFVPNNVVANQPKGIQSQYYDVTLSAKGITRLSYSTVTVDKLTINGPAELDIKGVGKLKVLGDFTQIMGWTNVDGLLKSSESLMVNGLLTGIGTFDPTYFTNIQGVIAPGSLGLAGTLRVKGDVILSSESRMYFDLTGTKGDQLAVRADADNPGRIIVDGSAMFAQGTGIVQPGDATPVRYGQVFPIVTSDGGVAGTFNDVSSSLPGVLYVDVAYKPNEVDAVIKANSLATMAKSSGDASSASLKFAAALDTLRGDNYANLPNVFGAVDVMSAKQLAASLRGLAPATAGRARTALDRQRITAVNLVADRLSQLGGAHAATGLSLIGSPGSLMRLAAHAPARTLDQRPSLLALSSAQAPQLIASLPEGMSGFVAGGYTLDGGNSLSSSTYDGMRSWHLAMGLEQQLGANTVLGFSTGVGGGASGQRRATDWTRDNVQQMAVYGTQRLGGGAYVAGLMSAVFASGDTGRRLSLGGSAYDLRGAPGMHSFTLAGESGVNMPLGRSLMLTPRVGLRYAATHVGSYREDGGDAALLIDKRDYAHAETRLGAKLGGMSALGGGWSFAPSVQADWVRNVSGRDAGVRARFAAASDLAIDLPGEARARQWGEVRGGFQVTKGALALGLVADGSTGGALGDSRALATLGYAF